MSLVDVNGTTLYYERRGDGPAVVLVSGATGDAGHWTMVAEVLSSTYTVVTYDRRGNSRSPPRSAWMATTIDEQADDARALIDGLHIAALIGAGFQRRGRHRRQPRRAPPLGASGSGLPRAAVPVRPHECRDRPSQARRSHPGGHGQGRPTGCDRGVRAQRGRRQGVRRARPGASRNHARKRQRALWQRSVWSGHHREFQEARHRHHTRQAGGRRVQRCGADICRAQRTKPHLRGQRRERRIETARRRCCRRPC